MTVTDLHRSLLFVPASNARAMKKAPSLAADGYIFDLEDSVEKSRLNDARLALINTV